MFEGFKTETVSTLDGSAFVRHNVGGNPANRPVVVLLHSHPRTSATWHRVAPLLSAAGIKSSARTCAVTAALGALRPRQTIARTASALPRPTSYGCWTTSTWPAACR